MISHWPAPKKGFIIFSVSGLQSDIDVWKAAVDRNKELLSEKERELVRRVQAAREEEMQKMTAIQEEK